MNEEENNLRTNFGIYWAHGGTLAPDSFVLHREFTAFCDTCRKEGMKPGPKANEGKVFGSIVLKDDGPIQLKQWINISNNIKTFISPRDRNDFNLLKNFLNIYCNESHELFLQKTKAIIHYFRTHPEKPLDSESVEINNLTDYKRDHIRINTFKTIAELMENLDEEELKLPFEWRLSLLNNYLSSTNVDNIGRIS